jgi:hypothetical protein
MLLTLHGALQFDALYLLQDSTNAKAIEVGEMGRIYKNATITIATANS